MRGSPFKFSKGYFQINMYISLKRLSPSYLDPKKAHLQSEMFIKLRGKTENRIPFSNTVTHLAAPLPYHFGSAHHPVTHLAHHSQMLHPSSSPTWLITWLPAQ